jgi:hypothetical protein
VPTGGTPFFAIIIPTGDAGPGDLPHPEHPIAGGPWPTHPIVFPPGTRPPWAGGGQPPTTPEHPIVVPPDTPTPPPGSGVVVPLPPPADGSPAPTPPEGMPPDSAAMLAWFGPGTKPVPVWVPPYPATHPPA